MIFNDYKNEITPFALYAPYAALTARFDNDLDGNPSDGNDWIEHMVEAQHGASAMVRRYHIGYDFTCTVELDDRLLVLNLGTDTKTGGIKVWLSNAKALPITDNTHNGFYEAGWKTFKAIQDEIEDTNKPVIFIGQSRGASRSYLCKKFFNDVYRRKSDCFTYCPPKTFTKKGVMEFNRLTGDTFSILSHGDIVDNLGFGILKNCGTVIDLPKSGNIISRIPFIGGHAYTSYIDGMIKMFAKTGHHKEVMYLTERKGWCEI
jgi:hypothetical protein